MLGKKLKNKVIGGMKTGPLGGGGGRKPMGTVDRSAGPAKPYMAEGGRVKKKKCT